MKTKLIQIIKVFLIICCFYTTVAPGCCITDKLLACTSAAAGLLLAAAACFLRHSSRYRKTQAALSTAKYLQKTATTALLCCFAISAGIVSEMRINRQIFASPLLPDSINIIEGTAAADSRKGATSVLIPLKNVSLSSVENLADTPSANLSNKPIDKKTALLSGRCRGTALLFSSGNLQIFRGQQIKATVSPGRAGRGIFRGDIIESRAPAGFLQKIRAGARSRSYRVFSNSPAGGMMNALFLGDRSLTPPQKRQLFMDAGCMHLLALSGMHLGIVAAAAALLFSKLLRKKAALTVTAAAEAGYCFLITISPSLIRALIMALLAAARSLGRFRWSALGVTAAAFFIQVLISPVECCSAGFLLSYLAVFGIIIMFKPINTLLIEIFGTKLSAPVSVALSAITMTLPVIFHISGKFNLSGIPASICATIPVTLLIFIAPVFYLTSQISPSAAFLPGKIAEILSSLTEKILMFFGGDGAIILTGKNVFFFYLIEFLLLFFCYFIKIYRHRQLRRLILDKL